MTFSEYIIQERSKNYYYIVCGDIGKFKNITLEQYCSNLYDEYKMLYNK